MSVLNKERLTERTKEGICTKEDYEENALKTLYQCYGAEPLPHYANCDEGYCAMEKLAEYEELEEQGLLFQIPCRCKDCKHVDYVGCLGTTCYCMKNSAFMQEDDFCNHAEKDESEAEEKLRELEEK